MYEEIGEIWLESENKLDLLFHIPAHRAQVLGLSIK